MSDLKKAEEKENEHIERQKTKLKPKLMNELHKRQNSGVFLLL